MIIIETTAAAILDSKGAKPSRVVRHVRRIVDAPVGREELADIAKDLVLAELGKADHDTVETVSRMLGA